ncbi:hypothetical protein BDV29DRAFT_184874 [Aspergillus leporis]|uniref:Uncharacterized protein n=1 Tax=Aspergillus leporis TaxID=41062 RepID=A0A5N5WIB4_9EURO|nr:hypothetical protein BDV29DRAFT_184874 [Aspergillus leporis]
MCELGYAISFVFPFFYINSPSSVLYYIPHFRYDSFCFSQASFCIFPLSFTSFTLPWEGFPRIDTSYCIYRSSNLDRHRSTSCYELIKEKKI